MTQRVSGKDLSISILSHLRTRMRSTGEDFQYILARYVLERLMVRISLSAYSNRFIVKGAMLFLLWDQIPFRSTLDLDLTLDSMTSQSELIRIFTEMMIISIKEDAVIFLPSSLSIEPIREQEAYSGFRLHLRAQLGKTVTPVCWLLHSSRIIIAENMFFYSFCIIMRFDLHPPLTRIPNEPCTLLVLDFSYSSDSASD
jgi:hypothetical protein